MEDFAWGASTDGGDYWGYDGEGVPEIKQTVCRGVDPSEMYHTKHCDGRMSLALMIAMLVLGFVTVLVNLGVIIRTIKIVRQGHDKPAFYFIGNLALSDFAVGLYVVIAFLLHITNKSDLWQQKTCMLQIGVAVTACQETIFTIVLISVDKYLYICHGLHYSRMMTRGRVYAALALSWCLALLVGSLPALGLHVTWPEACNRCAFAQVISTTFAVIFFITSVAIPLVVVVALYTILLTLALKMHKARYGGSYTARESARSSNFRLSFMSKRSRVSISTGKTALSTTTSSSSSSSSSSKASRRRTRRREMEEYKKELKRRDGVDSGGAGVGVGMSSPLSKISESVELIEKTESGVSGGDSGVESASPPRSDPPHGDERLDFVQNGASQGDIASPVNPVAPGGSRDTGEGDREEVHIRGQIPSHAGVEDQAGEASRHREEEQFPDPLNVYEIKTDEEREEDPSSDPEVHHRFTLDEREDSGRQKATRNPQEKFTTQMNNVGGEETGEDPSSDPEVHHTAGSNEGKVEKHRSLREKLRIPTNGVGTKADEETVQDPASDPGTPHGLTSDEEGATTDDGEGETRHGGKGGWRKVFPSRYMNHVMTQTKDKMLFLKKCRALKTVLLILVSFIATYVPFVVGSLVYSAQKEKRPCLLHLLSTLLYCAVVANSLANPLIYAYGYREFRLKSERFKGVFAREKPREYS